MPKKHSKKVRTTTSQKAICSQAPTVAGSACRTAPTRALHRLGIIFLQITALLFYAACQPQASEQPELQAFAQAFRQANEAPSIDPMLALYELEGSSEWTVNRLKNALLYEHQLPIQSIHFEPLSGAPDERIDFRHQNIEYGPTLEPRLRMRVRYATEDGFESLFTIGQNVEDAWRIVSSRPL